MSALKALVRKLRSGKFLLENTIFNALVTLRALDTG